MIPLPPISAGGGGPSHAETGIGSIVPTFDNSGWTVATGGSKATASRAQSEPGLLGLASASAGGIPPVFLIVGGLLALALLWKKFH